MGKFKGHQELTSINNKIKVETRTHLKKRGETEKPNE
jgi:hypothetical protein